MQNTKIINDFPFTKYSKKLFLVMKVYVKEPIFIHGWMNEDL